MLVVPDESDRWKVWMASAGSVAPELRALMAGSFHLAIFPAKIPAMVAASSFRSLTPLTWYSMATPPAAHGICRMVPLLASAWLWLGLSTASDAPKSTVPDVNWVMPAPEPTAW